MSKKRHPNECPSCQKTPCQCAGGSAADENTKDKNANTQKDIDGNKGGFIHAINSADIHTKDKTNVFFQKYDNEFMLSATPTPKPVANAHRDVEKMQNNCLACWCTLFATTAKQLVLMPSSNLQQEDSTNNPSSMGMGMSISGMDE